MTRHEAFALDRRQAIEVLARVWGGARQWVTVFEQSGAPGELIDKVHTAFRKLEDIASPELVNSDPFGEGWLIKVEFAELPALLSFDEYSKLTGE